jgi:hypothetical protein
MKKLTLLVLFVTSFSFAQTQKISSLETVQQYSKAWSELFLQGKIADMFDEMKGYWLVPVEKIDGMKTKTLGFQDMIQQNYGNPIDAVRISGQNLADVAYREVYFLRHEKSTLRAIFTYYNNGSGWQLSSFEWDDSFSKEFAKEQ